MLSDDDQEETPGWLDLLGHFQAYIEDLHQAQ